MRESKREGIGVPPQTKAVGLLKKYFLHRTDKVCVETTWGKPCPASTEDLDALLAAHVGGEAVPEVAYTLHTKDPKRDSGRPRVGAYMPGVDGLTKVAVIDLDGGPSKSSPLADPQAEARKILARARELEVPIYIEISRSGDGYHGWVPFAEPIPAKLAREVAGVLVPENAILADGSPADVLRHRGIEIFPKQERIGPEGYGSAVWLPWSSHGNGRTCLFVRLMEDRSVVPYVPDAFEVTTLAKAEQVLAATRRDTGGAPSKPQPKRKPHRGKKDRVVEWYDSSIAVVPLDDRRVYGAILAGGVSAKGWMTARDPSSPSGDKSASAGVADVVEGFERGTFHSFRDGRYLTLPEFLVEHGEADDLIQAYELMGEVSGIKPPLDALLPKIVVNDRHYRDVYADARKALLRRNKPPTLFDRLGIIVRVGAVGERLQILPLDRYSLYHRMGHTANWFKSTGSGTVPTKPPPDLAAAMIAHPPKGLPYLDQIATSPVFTEEGELIQRGGYYESAGIYYDEPKSLVLPPVPETPTSSEVAEALAALDDVLADFPFVSDSHRATVLSAILVLLVRRLIDGPIPIHMITAPTPANGKSLLANLVAQIGTGDVAQATTIGANDDEIRKKLTAELSRGGRLILLDNIDYDERKGRLDSRSLASIVTSRVWTDRLLGHSKMICVPMNALIIMTGNNPKFTTELARRMITCRLDSGLSRPWARGGFRHEDLMGYVKQNRGKLLHAVVVLVRHWMAEGRPSFSGRPLGSFEEWARVIGGILEVAGVEGFLENQDDPYDDADSETADWSEFVQKWCIESGGATRTISELVAFAHRHDLLPEMLGDGNDRSQQTRLGIAMSRQEDRVYGDHRIVRARDSAARGRSYELVEASPRAPELVTDEPAVAPGEPRRVEGSVEESDVESDTCSDVDNVSNVMRDSVNEPMDGDSRSEEDEREEQRLEADVDAFGEQLPGFTPSQAGSIQEASPQPTSEGVDAE